MDLGQKRTSLVIFENGAAVSLNLFGAESCDKLAKTLDDFLPALKVCTHLFCEQQMTSNYKAQRIQAWIEMWVNQKTRMIFVIFPSRLKYDGQKLGKYHVRKRWAVLVTRKYLSEIKNLEEQFATFKPQADVADALVIGLNILGYRLAEYLKE